MEIKTEEYVITYETDTNTVICQGSLRLSGMDEYTPMVELLNNIVDSGVKNITLNLKELEFLNSSGINVLSKFVIKVRQQGSITMVVVGSNNIPWQGKSLKNL
ncbi:MAG TPA: STAS domain-containing protein, partial [Allocoleopsis sp.]